MPLMGTDKSYNPTSFRRGFGNYEKDDEVYGFNGSNLDMGERLYDSRIALAPTVDPRFKDFSSISPYVFAGDNPIAFTDDNGEGPGYSVLKALAVVGSIAVETSGSVSLGAIATASKGMAVDHKGNVALYKTKGGLLNSQTKGPSFNSGANVFVGVGAAVLPGLTDVRQLKGKGGNLAVNGSAAVVGIPIEWSAGVVANSDDQIVGANASIGLGISTPVSVSWVNTLTEIVAFTAADYQKITLLSEGSWSRHYLRAKEWNSQIKDLGIWEVANSYLEYIPVKGKKDIYEATVTTNMIFKPHGTAGARETQTTVSEPTGVFFTKDKDGNLTSTSFTD